jgi:alpha-mannosidase
VSADNSARDHRLRLLFPSGRAAAAFRAATTFDVVESNVERPDDRGWQQRAPSTFPHQGWVSVNGLTVVAPGLPEAEVTPAGTIALTLLRSIGWLSRFDLRTRPAPAGPAMPLAAAQGQGRIEAEIHLLLDGGDAVAARDAEVGLRAVFAGDSPLLDDGRPLLEIAPDFLLLSALKPAEEGAGLVVRVLNPSPRAVQARLRLGFPCGAAAAVRLDEEPAAFAVQAAGDTIELEVPPHALRTLLIPVST